MKKLIQKYHLNLQQYTKNKIYYTKGFTLIEIIVVTAILALTSLMVGSFVIQAYKTWSLVQDQGEVQEQVKNTINKMTKEIRETQTAQNGAYYIEEAEERSLSFYSNIDPDSDIEKIRYFLDENNLKKGIIEPTGNPSVYPEENEKIEIIASSIANIVTEPIFSYFDENYKGTEDPLSHPVNINLIRLIKIELIIDKDTGKNPPPYALESEVNLRNLKTNL